MKLNQILTLHENSTSEHELFRMLCAAVEEISDNIEHDYEEEKIVYPKDLLMDDYSTLFASHGKCLAEAHEILDHIKNEKLKLLIAGYDPGYEEAFICPTSPEMLVRNIGNDKVRVTFWNRTFDFERDELEKIFVDFYNAIPAKFSRIKDRKPTENKGGPWPGWRPRRLEDDGFPRDLNDSDFNFIGCNLYGAIIYEDLSY